MEFMGKDFLLEGKTAKTLYHDYASKMPIVDYHCHISPKEIYENHRFEDIAEAWLGGDHYKWRLMRACGVDEKYISGDASGWEKFKAFAEVLPRAIGNPVYHWAHLELQRYFGCHTVLTPDTAEEIWNHCNKMLQNDENLRVRGVIEKSGVTALCTTDDPVDDLQWHKKLVDDSGFNVKVLPAFRTDKVLSVEKPGYVEYVQRLSEVYGQSITNLEELKKALCARMDYFDSLGCVASDQGIDSVGEYVSDSIEAEQTMLEVISGGQISKRQAEGYRSHVLEFLGEEYAKRGWVMEIHFGAMRNANSKQFDVMGPDTGYDCVSTSPGMQGMARMLDSLEKKNALPKILIFSMNPGDNAAINTLAGCFQKKGSKGYVQQGSAWWFGDTISGMIEQMESFANSTVFANFVGMLTDSRSFFSYTRHEYFRRILCGLIGGWVDSGLYPDDMTVLSSIVQDISYNNANEFFFS